MGQDFLETKKFMIRNKNRGAGENFFDLKDSKRVKINDWRLNTRFLTFHTLYFTKTDIFLSGNLEENVR